MDQITDELLQKTIGEMSGMEFIQLFKVANDVKADDSQENEEDKYVYGIAGIAELFHCSLPTANRIKKRWIRKWHLNWLDSPLFTAEEHNYVKSCTQNRKNSSICIVIWKQIINFAPSIHYERRN